MVPVRLQVSVGYKHRQRHLNMDITMPAAPTDDLRLTFGEENDADIGVGHVLYDVVEKRYYAIINDDVIAGEDRLEAALKWWTDLGFRLLEK